LFEYGSDPIFKWCGKIVTLRTGATLSQEGDVAQVAPHGTEWPASLLREKSAARHQAQGLINRPVWKHIIAGRTASETLL
jgi:hypothetical protein